MRTWGCHSELERVPFPRLERFPGKRSRLEGITYSPHNPFLNVWNVSQPRPLDKIRLSGSGIAYCEAWGASSMVHGHHGQGSLQVGGSSSSTTLLTSFQNGSVAVSEVAANRTSNSPSKSIIREIFATRPAHSETIFDIAFSPVNANVIGTASYDGCLKLWNVAKRTSFREMWATFSKKDGPSPQLQPTASSSSKRYHEYQLLTKIFLRRLISFPPSTPSSTLPPSTSPTPSLPPTHNFSQKKFSHVPFTT